MWLGDLNYRLASSKEEHSKEEWNEEVRRRVAEVAAQPAVGPSDFDSLKVYDQLGVAQASGAAFPEFEEAPIEFAPTYKYASGTSVYDR